MPTDRAITDYRLIIFDADGTLRRTLVKGQPCPNTPDEWELMPHVRDVIGRLPTSTIIGIISNQAGVALGYLSYDTAETLLNDLYREATGQRNTRWKTPFGGTVLLCPHAPDDGCICRKPYPAMICDVMRGASVYRRKDVLYVGDMPSDQECAERAGVDFMWAKDFFDWE